VLLLLSIRLYLVQVPACYLHNPPRLQPGYFAKFQQDTLFYIFYSMPGDEAQLLAADELSARQWWFHKVRHCMNLSVDQHSVAAEA
jgi:CCR4-NOT transcriptional regulation complex NOT5 subunit